MAEVSLRVGAGGARCAMVRREGRFDQRYWRRAIPRAFALRHGFQRRARGLDCAQEQQDDIEQE